MLPLIVISFFNHPVGDDYWFSSLVRKDGFSEAYAQIRHSVSARYTALSLMAVNPLVFGNFFLYKIIPVAFIIIFFLSLTYLLTSLNQQKPLHLSAIVTATYFAVMPGIGEGLYWTSSLCVYQGGIAFLMLWAAMLSRWYIQHKKIFITAVIACFCLVATAGCNEILAGLLLIATSILLIKKKDSLSVIMFLLSLTCVLYVVTAKSFTERYHASFQSTRIIHSAYLGIQYTGYHIVKCLVNPFFWIGLLLAQKIKPPFSLKKAIMPWLALMFFIEFIAVQLSSNHIVPLRITNMMVFFLLIGIFCWLPLPKLPYKYLVACVLFAVGMFTKNNISTATKELLNGEAAAYNREMNNRYKIIRACSSDTCEIPQLQHRPTTLRYSSNDDDPHIGEYFNKALIYK